MNIVTGIVVYVIIWWLTLFMVLPFGVRRDKDPQPGHDPGAPKAAHIGRKMVITTAIASLLFLLFWAMQHYRLVTLE